MMRPVTQIRVGLDFGTITHQIGRLAINENTIYFEYNEAFIQTGIQISPFRLPLRKGLIELPQRPFEGLAGVFSDSLPDGWGRLLFDRLLRSQGTLPATISPLDRLAHVGLSGMGALVYEPDHSPSEVQEVINLDQLALQSQEVLQGSSEEVIRELLALNGSSAGARPKALIAVHEDRQQIIYGTKKLDEGFEPWLVKFTNSRDGSDAGAIEYVYALMAREAGVVMPEVHLFPSRQGAGHFAVKRFDREGNKRLHMHTASGLLHSDFRVPSLDYEDLLTLTGAITKDIREVKKMYRLAVFNVLAYNRDDHAKNFSFLMDNEGRWKLSPAYDLTFASGPNGEQSMTVMGEGKNPAISHLIKLGREAKLPENDIEEIIGRTRHALDSWRTLATNHHVLKSNIDLVSKTIGNNK